MNPRHIPLTGVAIALLASTPALARHRHDRDAIDARGHDDRRATIEMLEHKDDSLQRESMERRIGAVEREQISEQRRLIDDVIDDLEDGRPVAAYTIDEAMGYPYHSHHFFHRHDREHEHDVYGS